MRRTSDGGQNSHTGHTLEKVAQQDRIVRHAPPVQCDVCHRILPEARVRLQPTVDVIGLVIQGAEVARADEIGMRVAGSLRWMHALATGRLARVVCNTKRGREAFEAITILPSFLGTLIHDGWKPYREQP